MILKNNADKKLGFYKRMGLTFVHHVIYLLLILTLTSCMTSARLSPDDIRLIELQAEYKNLQDSYVKMKTRLEKLDGVFDSRSFLEPKEIVEAVRLTGGGETLKQIRDREILHCGSVDTMPGLGFLDPKTKELVGFEIDFCRAIATAIFAPESTNSVRIIPLTSRQRFSALQSEGIDLLIRNTTWTLTRDTTLPFDFGPVIFYDGQSVMVPLHRNFDRLEDLAGETVCVAANTTTTQNILRIFTEFDAQIQIQTFEDFELLRKAYEDGICDGFTADKSALVIQRKFLAEPDNHKIFDQEISREPLAPVIRHGDANWHDIVFWTIQCTINAEYLGVNHDNVASLRESDDPKIQNLLGVKGDLGQAVGLRNDFCYHVIDQVGNYADIYERHLGHDTPFKLPRNNNALFNEGGLLYPIPFR